ncbi:RING finger protein 17 isoform X2 [Malaya genurostris]|uniref:RING finger protein 17 isoform X2 n=1 Tax=Malaya genurostris TaxID=325434 RepID=UPI0026F3F315|nr:RING finger protein 17 isoform X2 [Malaya genurostris]
MYEELFFIGMYEKLGKTEAIKSIGCIETLKRKHRVSNNNFKLVCELRFHNHAYHYQQNKNTERILEKQKEYTNQVLTEITDYFFSLHNVLQSVEQELLISVKNSFLKLNTEATTVQRELHASGRHLKRSIEQFKTFQVAVPRQTLLTDLIKDMKKMLHTAPVTAKFQEPDENPFRFREREPFRKEVRNFFELNYKPNSYQCKLVPYYQPDAFPVLETINSPEPIQESRIESPIYESRRGAISRVGAVSTPPVKQQINRSVFSSDDTLKDDPSSKHNSSSKTPESSRIQRDSLIVESGKSAEGRIKSSKNKRKNKKGSNSRRTPPKDEKPTQPNTKQTVVSKARSEGPDLVMITSPVQQSSRHSTGGGNRNPYPKHDVSKRSQVGRLRSHGSTSSAPSDSNQRGSPISPAEPVREKLKPVLEINPINPDNASFIKFSQKVNVTCVLSPNKFYVQNQTFKSIVNELCQDDGATAEEPEDINVGSLYLAQPTSESNWYRARILSRAKHGKKYEVFFVDYGRTEEISRGQIRVLSADLEGFASGASECTLYDLVPADGSDKWSAEARQIMIDFIENKQMIMYLVQHDENNKDEPMHVDLISQTIDSPKSLRHALLYLNLAKRDPKSAKRTSDSLRKIDQLEKVILKWISEYKRTIIPRELEKDDVFKAKITCSMSPSEFYICKNAWLEKYNRMQQELNEYCTKDAMVAFSPHVAMVCAFAEKDAEETVIWRRGRVLKLGEAHCEIVSVDTGHRLLIPWQDIRYIPKQFCTQAEFVVCCKLLHIQPFKQYNYRWTDEAIADFNRLANSNSVFQIIVDNRDVDLSYDVVLYIVRKRYDTCVNALMVKNGFAVSTGSESIVVERAKDVPEEDIVAACDSASVKTTGSKSSTSEKRKTRVRVEILRVVSPGEFYISLVKNASGVSQMQEEIQNRMDDKMDDGDDKKEWKVGELCLVFPTLMLPGTDGISCEWYRARVIEIVDDSNYTVFLIDKAYTMNAHYSNMSAIPDDLKQVHPAAIRCFLACIGPTGNNEAWSSSVIDAFKVAIDKFECFAISLHGRSVNDSLPVILWGMIAESAKALSPQLFQYANINNNLVQYGYVHLKEKFMPLSAASSVEEELLRHYQAFDQFFQALDVDMEEPLVEPSYSGSCDTYQDDLTDEPTPIDRWLPAKPIDKTIFVGVPTYVDNNGVIYLHDMEKESILTALKKVINGKFEGSQQLPSDKFYSNGEPCLAKFHIDDQFYRALIRKAISPCRYKVQFVDYGNIEECDVQDLRKNVICGRVPILVNKYRLTDVAPKDADVVWKTDVLDTMHSLIVGKQCQVRVDTDMDTDAAGVVPCYLKVTGVVSVDVSEYLLNQKLVVKKHAVFEEKVDQLYDPYMNLFGSKKRDTSPKSGRLRIAANFGQDPGSDSESADRVPSNDFRGRFTRQELDDLFEHVANEQSRAADCDEDDGEDSIENGVDLNKVQYFYSFGDVKQELDSDMEDGEVVDTDKTNDEAGGCPETDGSSNVSFNPNEFDTSTQIDPPLELTRPTLHGFPQFQLDESITGFYCEVTNLINPFNLFVFPQMEDHIQRMKEMMAKIQCYVRKHRKCSDIEENMSCLALFKQDNFWYRGIIEKYFPDRAEVLIFYVDYLNKETISVRDILKCPVSLRRVPLRNVQVQLHAIRGNPRMRESDIMMKLVELIEGKRIYAKVASHSPTLEVELYTDSKCTNLIYHKMIKEKFFLVADDGRSRQRVN